MRCPRAAAMPGVRGPASQTVLDPSLGDASAARTARSVSLMVTRCGLNAAERSLPMPTTGIGPFRAARSVSPKPTGP